VYFVRKLRVRVRAPRIIRLKGIEMGWSDASTTCAAAPAGRQRRRTDALPLGARIGSVVGIQQSPLLRRGRRLADRPAGAGDVRIVAVSQLRLKQSGGLYRYYLDTGDRDDKEKFLQVYQNASGEVSEILYCTQLARVIPQTVEDQDAYTGQSGAGLGDRSYTLWRQQLEDDPGLDLDLIFGASDGLDYWRDAGDPEAASCRRSPAPKSVWTTPAAVPACARKCISCRTCASCAAAATNIC
jgi:hypothetical protein